MSSSLTVDSNAPTIPDRNSSLNFLSTQKRKIEDTIEEARKKMRFRGSLDEGLWSRLEDLGKQELEHARLGRKNSMMSMGFEEANQEDLKAWQNTVDGAQLIKQEATLKKQLSATIKQRAVISDTKADSVTRRSYVSQFIGSRLGLNLNNSRRRDESLQKQFKNELQSLMGRSPKPDFPDYAWCPIQQDYLPVAVMKAAHLFPARCGHINMTAIFGPAEQLKWIDQKYEPGAKSELFRACNGIYWSSGAEERFGKGLFVLVPDLDSDATSDEIKTWQASAMKEYRIRVLRPDASEMKRAFSPTSEVAWNTIDGQRVQWGDPSKPEVITFRPRARYLYWAYLSALLQWVYAGKDAEAYAKVAQQEVGRKFWGTAGSYMNKHMLRAFVEELGHDYEPIMEAAREPGESEEEGPEELGVWCAIEGGLEGNKSQQQLLDDDDDEDDEDDEDNDDSIAV
ncbi:MAG: hypothetical protein Q9195_004843 [Heterodermia aff. obscurata]